MATHSSILAWRIPWTEETSRLQSTGSQRVRHDWHDLTQAQKRNIGIYQLLGIKNKRLGLVADGPLRRQMQHQMLLC